MSYERLLSIFVAIGPAALALQPSASAQAVDGTEPEGPVLALALEDAYRIALENNLSLAISALEQEVARVQAVGSWGAFDPVFDLAFNYTDGEIPQSNPVITGGTTVLDLINQQLISSLTVPVTSGGQFQVNFDAQTTETNSAAIPAGEFTESLLGVGFTQPLLRGAWRSAATAEQRDARLLWLQERERQRETLETILLSVSDAYWDLVAAQELVRVRELSVELGRTQLEQEEHRLRVGVGTEVDVLQAETQIASEEEQLLLARSEVGTRSDVLKSLLFRREGASEGDWNSYLDLWDLAVRPLTPLPTDVEGDVAFTWRASLERAFEHRPDLGRLRLAIDSAEVRLELAESNRLPLLNLDLGYRGNATDTDRADSIADAVSFDFPTWNAGLRFQRPFGNRTLRNAERAARIQLISARLAFEQAENLAIEQVRSAARDLTYRSQAVVASRKSRQFAERQLAAEETRQQEGLSTTFQVLQFQRDLAQALSNEAQSMSVLAKAKAALLRAEGRLVSQVDLEPLTLQDALQGDPSDEPETHSFAGQKLEELEH